jgi:peptidoglycan/xylan/chitin deacetylase (PgdA/CDA1 family)
MPLGSEEPNTFHILLYHGVHGDDVELAGRNSSGKHISAARFRAQMQWLAQNRPVVSMETIAEAYRKNQDLPDGAVVLTLDDGFLNNYTEVWPVLEEYGLPATFYLATGFIGTGRMVWSDILEANVLGANVARITLNFPDGPLGWPLDSIDDKVAAFLKIKEICKRLPNDAKDEVMAQVTTACRATVATDHPLYAFMSWDDVRRMNASPLVEFGAHTVDHVSLAKVSHEVMACQIDDSIAALEHNLGQTCRFFSYPEGQEDDYSDSVIDYLKYRNLRSLPNGD